MAPGFSLVDLISRAGPREPEAPVTGGPEPSDLQAALSLAFSLPLR